MEWDAPWSILFHTCTMLCQDINSNGYSNTSMSQATRNSRTVDGHFRYGLFCLNLYDKGKYWQPSIQSRLEWYSTCLCFQNQFLSEPPRTNSQVLDSISCVLRNIFQDSRVHSQSSKKPILDSKTCFLKYRIKTYLVSCGMIVKAWPAPNWSFKPKLFMYYNFFITSLLH